MVVLHTEMFKVSPGEDQRTEIVIDDLEQGSCRSQANARSVDTFVAAVAVDSLVVLDATSSSASERLNGENVTLLHALVSLAFDERHLFVAVDLVAQNVVACEASDSLHWNGLAVELNLVTLHDLLDDAADMIHTSVDTGFL